MVINLKRTAFFPLSFTPANRKRDKRSLRSWSDFLGEVHPEQAYLNPLGRAE